MSTLYPDVASLLRAHGVSGDEDPIAHDGYSGAVMSALESSGQRYLIKRDSFERDWMLRTTDDRAHREAQFAASELPSRLPARVAVPMLGGARDGDGAAVLMRDIAPALEMSDGVQPKQRVDAMLAAAAELHAAFWGDPLADVEIEWTPRDLRLSMLSRDAGAMLVREGRDFGLERGWQVFDKIAPEPAVRLLTSMQRDIAPLTTMLAALPQTLVHGDLKLGNMGLDGDTLWLIDWSLIARATVAEEMAWFLAVNSSRLPWSLDETAERYRAHIETALGARRGELRWDEQMHAAALCGLLLYGWGKALDAEAGRADELTWWCDRAVAAAQHFGW